MGGTEAEARRQGNDTVRIQQIVDAVRAIEAEIERTPAGAPEYAAIVARIAELERELKRAGAVLGPLIPNASSPKSADEESVVYLGRALQSLMKASEAKR